MIEQTQEGDLRIVTINRPDKAGALTRDMLVTLAEIAEQSQAVKALIITGTGPVFSAGADLAASRAGLATDPVWERLSSAIAGLPGLTIAALNGTAAGGALGMVLACDLRIAVASANIFYPVMKLGFLPQPSDPPRMRALIGPARSKMILMAGKKIPATQAQDWGLIDQISEPATLLTDARALCADALQADPAHIEGIKRLIAVR
ncbi:enoyl-CoA hydratase/isomerase family protein [Yoonia sp. SS1-5]|uniref:Enoyl-CoA hydratase/isomerase family protein n=1 Tax=Yoonia rhodophyticola TaxID=3137370 RepID=A0AAN0MAQ3_9RHOB